LLVDIYPPSLHTSGLTVALRDLARTATAATDIELTISVDDEVADALPESAREATFRVAQEALRNVVRHSGATHVTLGLRAMDDDRAILEIIDNGRGFDASSAYGSDDNGHFGLQLMADAARRGSAGLSFSTPPGGGTDLQLEVPRT
jgi:signal transduction histidine kinase